MTGPGDATSPPTLPPQRALPPPINPPPVGGGLGAACARSLNSPVLVTDIGDGAFLVEPLHFHRVVGRGREGQSAVAKYHDIANTGELQRDPI